MLVMLLIALTATAASLPVGRSWWRDRCELLANEDAYRKAVSAAVHAGHPSLGQTGMLPHLFAGLGTAAIGSWVALVVPTDWFLLTFAVSGLVVLC